MKVNRKNQSINEFQFDYSEIVSSYSDKINLSICSVKLKPIEKIKRVLFFIPEMGMSYKNYFSYFEKILSLDICDQIISFDHFGNGISGGVRGINVSGKKYLNDCKNIYSQNINNISEVIVFGHGFGATLALVLESEGFFKQVKGIIIKDPFFSKKNKNTLGKPMKFLLGSKKLKRYMMQEIFSGKDYFPKIEDQLDFEVECINSRKFSLDFLDTLQELTKGVIERAYLAEKPILFLHGMKRKMKKSGELITLYQKGVGENKVTSVELSMDGHFENFRVPVSEDLMVLQSWINNLI